MGDFNAKVADLRSATINDRRIIGLQSLEESGTSRVRYDIEVLMTKNPDTFNLFLRALRELQHENLWTSYFAIAGIHGLPKVLWDGVQGKNLNVGPRVKWGYCPHSTETFPTWHRPYLALMEQALYLRMVEIAQSYRGDFRERYITAAKEFRLPFWDWFRPRAGPVTFQGVVNGGETQFPYDYSLPRILMEENVVTYAAPDNKVDIIPNPLRAFSFPREGSIPNSEWDSIKSDGVTVQLSHDLTIRHPTGKFDESDLNDLNQLLNKLRMDGTRLLLNMLVDDSYKTYDVWASNRIRRPTTAPDIENKDWFDWGPSGSLEGIHNTYHGVIGGHMGEVAVSAFDPIFWLHHCNIDRIFAMWQSVHANEPDTNWFPNIAKSSKYPDPAVGLSPFRKQKGGNDSKGCWTSTESQLTTTFGYQYADAVGKPNEVIAKLNKLYSWSISNIGDTFNEADDSMKPLNKEVSDSIFFKFPQPTRVQKVMAMRAAPNVEVKSSKPATAPATDLREWFVDDQVQRLALNGAFSIMYFISEEPGSRSLGPVEDFTKKPTFVALTYQFVSPSEICDNCGVDAEQGKIVANTNHITSMLMDYVKIGKLQSLRPEHVKPFLIERLRWRIVDSTGTLQDPRALAANKDLRINISSKITSATGAVSYEEYPDVVEAIIRNASPTPTAG